MAEDPPLFGHTVLVTRPVHQAGHLCSLIQTAGGNVVRCPAIEILPPLDSETARQQLSQLKHFDLAVFVSVNAVESALSLAAPIKLPNKLQLVAIGISTASCLEKHGYTDVIHPQKKFDSEALLATDAFKDIAGKHVAIIRGDSGREWLAAQLEKEGAVVERIAVYRRRPPSDSGKVLQQGLQDGDISIITVTSNEGLENLTQMAGRLRHKLLRLPLVVLSARNRDYALKLGYTGKIEIANQASNNAVLEALIRIAESRRCR